MQKAANLTVRVKAVTRDRLDALASATRRSRSFVIEDALEQYLEVNEWQVNGIQDALAEADHPDDQLVDHEDVLAQREARGAH